MRKALLVLFALAAICAAARPSPPDSTKVHELKEVVIEGANQHTSATKTTYIPTSRQKEMAEDAASLLSRMAIPQLDVNPITSAIKTLSGENIAIFINYIKAAKEDLTGMRPADVRRVEYMVYPRHIRFGNANYVINFIMVNYEWGGYTKFSARQDFEVKSTQASIFSKFAYKSMIYSVFLNENYRTSRHLGAEAEETFRFTDFDGNGAGTVTRFSSPLRARNRANGNNATFRAVYNSRKTLITNKISFSKNKLLKNDLATLLIYKDDFRPAATASTLASGQDMSLSYFFSASSILNQKLSFKATGNYQYSRNEPESRYEAGDVTIVNNAREDYHEGSLSGNLLWSPDERHSITATVSAEINNTSIDYLGTTTSEQRYKIYELIPGFIYRFTPRGLNAGVSLDWIYMHSEISGKKIVDRIPKLNLFAVYSPNRRNQFKLTWFSCKVSPETYQKSPTMLRQDELMWYSGNVELNNCWQHDAYLSYLWLPNNKWQMAADLEYMFKPDRIQTIYRPDGPGGAMLRQYINGGDYNSLTFNLNATARFFSGALVAKLNPCFTHTRVTGEYAMTLDHLDCTAQLSWYIGRCSLSGYYMTPIRYGASESGYCTRYPSAYQIQFGWRRKQWSVSASAVNFARSSWRSMRQTLTSEYYSCNRNDVYAAGHRKFTLSVIYTIGYGHKKVAQTDEIENGIESKSSILR